MPVACPIERTASRARFVTFPALDHLLFWENPNGFADVAASFLLGSEGARTDSQGSGTFDLNVGSRNRSTMPHARRFPGGQSPAPRG